MLTILCFVMGNWVLIAGCEVRVRDELNVGEGCIWYVADAIRICRAMHLSNHLHVEYPSIVNMYIRSIKSVTPCLQFVRTIRSV